VIRRRLPIIGAIAAILAWADAAAAQSIELTPMGGYRFGGDFFELVTNQPVDLDGAPVFGGMVNVALHDGLWFEGLYSHQSARVTVPSSASGPATKWRITVDHWAAGGLQEFGRGRAKPFLTGLLGLTHYAAEGDHEVRFTISAGGGVKLMPTPRVGLRLDGRVFATFVDVDGRAIACSPGICLVAFDANVAWQAEFSAGLVVAF
jgi:hypothetical protein